MGVRYITTQQSHLMEKQHFQIIQLIVSVVRFITLEQLHSMLEIFFHFQATLPTQQEVQFLMMEP